VLNSFTASAAGGGTNLSALTDPEIEAVAKKHMIAVVSGSSFAKKTIARVQAALESYVCSMRARPSSACRRKILCSGSVAEKA
jgi:hypothetical protein